MTGYGADALAGLTLGSNLLALPTSLEEGYQQTLRNRALLSNPDMVKALGLPPELLSGAFPTAMPFGAEALHQGLQTPVVGSLLRGIGGIGQIMQTVLGNRDAAPRPPVQELAQLAQIRRQNESEARDVERLGLEKQRIGLEQRRVNVAEENKNSLVQYRQTRADKIEEPRTPFTQWKKDNPTGTFADWSKAQASAAGQRAAATGAVKEEYAALPAPAQKTLADIDTLDGLVGDMRTMLQDPTVQANMGVFSGRLAQQLYNAGIATEGEDPYLALRAQVEVLGTQPYMRGTRNFQYVRQIQQHLPKPGDQPALVADKLDRLSILMEKMRHAIKATSVMTRGGIRRELGVPGPGAATSDQQPNLQGSSPETPGGITTQSGPEATQSTPPSSPTTTSKVPVTSQAIRKMADGFLADVKAGRMTEDQAVEAMRNVLTDPSFK